MIKKIVKKQIVFNGEISTPSSLGDGFGILYQKSDGKIYWRSNDVSETDLTSGGDGGGGGGGIGTVTSGSFNVPAVAEFVTTASLSLAGGKGFDYTADSQGTDTFFFVSGSIGSKNTTTKGSSVFGGDVIVSGSLSGLKSLNINGNTSGTYVATFDNDQSSNGHVLKLLTDGNGSGTRLLEMEDGDGDVIFRARADGRFGFGPDGVSSMGAGTFVVGIDNSSHTSDIAISKRLQHLGDSNTYLDFPSNDNITFAAGGSEELKIASDAVLVKEYIKHDGDTDTFIQFADDAIGITAGGEQLITISEAGQDIVKIGDGGDVDFQVRTLNDDNALFVVGSSDKVGIGVNDPDSKLEVLSTSTQQKWSYDSNSFATMTVGNSSNTTIASGETGKITVMAGGDIELNADGGDIVFKDDSATLATITSTNFGIGVTDPDEKLEVAGRIHISGETSTPSAPSDGDGGIMYVKTDGKLYFRSNEQAEIELTTTPSNPGATLTMGTGAAEDTKFLFDGNAVDFRIGINDSLDHFEIGAGTSMGSGTALRFTSTGDLVQIGSQTPSDGQVLYWDQTNSRVAWKTVAAGAALFFLLGGETAYNSNQFTYLGFTYATTANDYPSPWPRYDAVGTISLA